MTGRAARGLAWAAALLGAGGACARGADRTAAPDLSRERQAVAALRARLDAHVARQPHVREVLDLGAQSDVVVALRSSLVEEVVQEVARRYLDRVDLDLDLDVRVHERRQVELPTPLGRVTAGEWRLDLAIDRVRGVLRARQPEVRPSGGNRLDLRIPVALEGASGTARARFKWDARPLAGMVCRDFEVTRQVRGRVLADEYTLEGRFELTAAPQALVVQPVFPRRRFRLRIDLLPESWSEVREAIDEQDRLLRCGLAIDPDEILSKLKALLHGGFDVRLPSSLLRSVELPASVRQSVTVEGRRVDLAVESDEVRLTADAVWYGASLRSRLRSAPGTPSR